MAQVITMPRLSDTMTDGTVTTWLKKIGDTVKEGDILAEIETDKATMEFESFHSGILLYIGVQQGDTAPVDSILAIIGDKNEDISKLINADAPTTSNMPIVEQPQEKPVASALKSNNLNVITMPRLSDTMTEGTVASWLKNIGDTVKEGDILAEIETDKATMEFESFHSGTLLHIGVQVGQSAPVDSILAIIGEKGADISTVLNGTGASVQNTAPSVTVTEKQIVVPEQSNQESSVTGRVFASPLARKIAQDKGIDISKIKGSGENGRIVKQDVENYSSQNNVVNKPTAVAQPPVTAAPQILNEGTQEVKNSQMRKVIAKRLTESKFTAPHFYLNIEVNMDQAIASRKAINSIPDTKVSFNDMVIKAVAMALKKHPKVNSQWNNDTTLIHSHIHIGVAVAVDEGLVVPVVKYTDTLTLTQIGAAVKDLASRSRSKKIQPNEMEGSTFTISNLGMYGIESFTSIINQPNSAILSVGAIVEKPVVKNGQIVVGNTMMLSLACDHRTVDGATGAEFLQTLKQYIENPVTMLV
ncbi:MAG: 2-oxo acid dehydrogenase subunit E2 [Bacteroidota bacterium]|nr:2-oxo acid dehydrogenase subunit E2 [Bacteroidota bacterium]